MVAIISWSQLTSVVLSVATLASAYRPVQHCKHIGENGHYSACTSLTQHYNESSQESDLYIRYNWYKYKDSRNGWHAFGLGNMMAGALMFIMYGDPTAPNPEMTLSIRSAEGHHPPQILSDMSVYKIPEAVGRIPQVDIITSAFKVYEGPYVHPELNLKPTHVGVAEFIVRSYAKWIGSTVSNTSTSQPMIWSSKYDQDFNEDYSVDRSIEMHAFGMGFGFLYVDLLNAETSKPMFGGIDELGGLKGLGEYAEAAKPNAAELSAGDFAVANSHLDPVNARLGTGSGADEHNPFDEHSNTTPSTNPEAVENDNQQSDTTSPDASTSPTSDAKEAQRIWTLRGKTIRDWMWHLHGFFMCLAFFVFYPAGIYLLRSSKQISVGRSFNYHWTVNALGTVIFAIACFVGYVQSHQIHLTHQYVGLIMALLIGAQMLLGWRHHVKFIQIKQKTIMSKIHMGVGRVLLPLGFVNILSGLKLRQYGWFTMLLVLVLVIIEIVFGAVYLRGAHVRRAKMGGAAVAEELKAQGPSASDNAEEYFQLAEEDDLSDDSDVEDAANKKRAQKREENERLAKLDRV